MRSFDRLVDGMLSYGTPALFVLSLLLMGLFLLLGKMYRTPEEERRREERDDGIMMAGVWLLVVSELMGLAWLARGC